MTLFGIKRDAMACRVCKADATRWAVGGVEADDVHSEQPKVTAVIIYFYCAEHSEEHAGITDVLENVVTDFRFGLN
jgi:hypothetical protein